MHETRKALDIAKPREAVKWVPEIISTARQAMQFSKDARALAVQRQEEERIANDVRLPPVAAKAEAEDRVVSGKVMGTHIGT